MKIVCAWCGVVMSEGDEPVSHGICQPCTVNLEGEIDELPDAPAVLHRRRSNQGPRDKTETKRFTDSLSDVSPMVRKAVAAAESRADSQVTARRFH